MILRSFVLYILLSIAPLSLAGCFGSRTEIPAEETLIRTPRPTFTPTPAAPAQAPATPPPVADTAAALPTAPLTLTPLPEAEGTTGAAGEAVIAVINDDLVNIRSGPGLEYPVLGMANRGDEFTVVGKDASEEWWKICCFEEREAWTVKYYVDISGPVDTIAVAEAEAAPVATEAAPQPEAPAAPPSAETEAPTEPPAPSFPFNLVAQEQFPEANNLVRIFLYVYQGDSALPGYSVRVLKDGAELPVNATSADAAGMTWPIASPRQRFQNMKVEFSGIQPAGTWEVQLIDSSGAAAGPPASFSLTGTDTNRELYVRYEKP